jgi:hypothetical protein
MYRLSLFVLFTRIDPTPSAGRAHHGHSHSELA